MQPPDWSSGSFNEDTFEKEIGTTLKKTCDHGNSFCQFDLEMTLT